MLQWDDIIIEVLNKKIDRTKCDNYRFGSLVVHARKVL